MLSSAHFSSPGFARALPFDSVDGLEVEQEDSYFLL